MRERNTRAQGSRKQQQGETANRRSLPATSWWGLWGARTTIAQYDDDTNVNALLVPLSRAHWIHPITTAHKAGGKVS